MLPPPRDGAREAPDTRPTASTGDLPWRPDGDGLQARFEVGAGESRCAALSPRRGFDAGECAALQRAMTAFWPEWIACCRHRGPCGAAVERSALALKLQTYAPSGAIVAAPTTSQPEWIGGGRSWDDRYCGIRDARVTLCALAMLGYSGEAARFSGFMRRVGACGDDLQIMYGVEGETRLDEFTLDALEGHAGSRPVRVGNGAHGQRPTDVNGEFADWALLIRALGGDASAAGGRTLDDVARLAMAHAAEPEEGIWEMRGPPRQHVLGQVMCWVALDRATRLRGARPAWPRTMEALHAQIVAQGVADGALVRAHGSPARDASLLLIPLLLDFPREPALLACTVDAIEAELAQGDFVHRYRGDDGLDGTRVPSSRAASGASTRCWRSAAERRRCSCSSGCWRGPTTSGCCPRRSTRATAPSSATSRRRCPNSRWCSTQCTRTCSSAAARRCLAARWRALACAVGVVASRRVGRLWPSRASVLPRPLRTPPAPRPGPPCD